MAVAPPERRGDYLPLTRSRPERNQPGGALRSNVVGMCDQNLLLRVSDPVSGCHQPRNCLHMAYWAGGSLRSFEDPFVKLIRLDVSDYHGNAF